MDQPPSEDTPRVLVVDDEKVIREILKDFLSMEGFFVRAVEDGTAALEELHRRSYDLLLSDLKMPRMGGLELLGTVQEQGLNVLTIIMTGFGTVETAIEAMKLGAYDYILKPFKVEEVVHVLRRGLERQRLSTENMRLKEALSVYKISEAMGQTLSVGRILELVTDAALDEIGAEVAFILLQDEARSQSSGQPVFRERVRKARRGGEGLTGTLDLERILSHVRQGMPVLANSEKAAQFFRDPPRAAPLSSFCAVPLSVQHRVIGLLCCFSFTRGRTFTEGQRKMLSIIGSRAAVSLDNARLYENLLKSNTELETANLFLEENFRQTIVAFALALEENDPYTRGHSERVSEYARLIAEGIGMSPDEVLTVVQAALMHDIGKIGIRPEHLNKASRLNAEETAMFRNHPEKGKRILEPIPFLSKLIPGCYCHHEHYDGNGYPQGLAGDEIPLLGRVIAVADTYDAMTTDRAYRKALSHEVAVSELRRCAGTQFDPSLVDVFLRELERRRASAGAFPDDEDNLPSGSVPMLP